MITNVAKKLIASSLSDYTAIAKILAQLLDLKGLSTDLVNALTDRATKQKDVVIAAMAKEFSNFLSKINIADEAQKIMDGMTINVTATVSFKDRSLGTPTVHMQSTSKRKLKSKSVKK